MRKCLGIYEQFVLQAVEHLRAHASGTAIEQEIKKRTGVGVTPSTVYLILRKLEKRRLVSSKSGLTKTHGRRSIRYFRIEAMGRRELTKMRRMLKRMWSVDAR